MGKKKGVVEKGGGKNQASGGGEEKTKDDGGKVVKVDGCINPVGCKVGTPIDPKAPGDALRMTCSNGARCKQVLFLHAECLEALEEEMLKLLDAHAARSRRGSTWTEAQKVANLWNKKGYELLYKVCPCPCSGFLHKDIDYQPPVAPAPEGGQQPEEAKKKKKKQPKPPEKAAPVLNARPWGYQKTTQTCPQWYGTYHEPVEAHHHPTYRTTTPTVDEDVTIPGLHRRTDSSSPAFHHERRHSETPDKDHHRAAAWRSATPSHTKDASRSMTPEMAWPSLRSNSASAMEQIPAIGRGKSYDKRKDSSSTKGSHPSEQSEIETADELLSILNEILPNGPFVMLEVETAVNELLQNATIYLLSEIEECGGIWQWLETGIAASMAPFKLTKLTDGIVSKTERQSDESSGPESDDFEKRASPPSPIRPFKSPSPAVATSSTMRKPSPPLPTTMNPFASINYDHLLNDIHESPHFSSSNFGLTSDLSSIDRGLTTNFSSTAPKSSSELPKQSASIISDTDLQSIERELAELRDSMMKNLESPRGDTYESAESAGGATATKPKPSNPTYAAASIDDDFTFDSTYADSIQSHAVLSSNLERSNECAEILDGFRLMAKEFGAKRFW